MTDRPKKIAEEISGHIPAALMSKALAIGDKDKRCGTIGLLMESAVSESNLATHKGVDFWWNPESGFWVELGEKEMDTAAEILVRGMGLTPDDIFKRESRLIQMTKRKIQHKSLSPKRAIISFKNCALDVESGKTLKLSPGLDCTYGLPYNYDKGAECPLWMSFLDQVLPDVESRMVLQEYLGCIFINRHTTKLEKILYLYGGGSNGKGVVYETILGIVGGENVTEFDISHLAGTSSDAMYSLAKCDGKLLNYCSDSGKKEFSSSKFKTIVSGESTPARHPYGRPFMAEDLPVMIANSNELPVTVDSTYGYFRRLLVISFDVTIAENDQDKQLHLKMVKEYPGILNWILQGRDRFIRSGYKFTESKKVTERTRDYEIESNSILGYLREQRYSPIRVYIGHIPTIMGVKNMYLSYSSWCITMGLKPFSFNKFGSKLKEKGFSCGRRAAVEYGIYELPLLDDYRKLYARGVGEFTMEEYSVMLFGRDGDNIIGSVVENIVAKDAKDPLTSVFGQTSMVFTEDAQGADVEDDECP